MTPWGAPQSLHAWLYQLIEELCYDREYLYLAFVEHFTALMKQVMSSGAAEGAYEIPGIKSGRSARLAWVLGHRLSFMGPNVLSVSYVVTEEGDARERGTVKFDVSTGITAGQEEETDG
jgi:hypothetical protein